MAKLWVAKPTKQGLDEGIYAFEVESADPSLVDPKSGEKVMRVKMKAIRLDSPGEGIAWGRFRIEADPGDWLFNKFLFSTGHDPSDDGGIPWDPDELKGRQGYLVASKKRGQDGRECTNYYYKVKGDEDLCGFDEDDDGGTPANEPVTESKPETKPALQPSPETVNNKASALLTQLRARKSA